MTIKADYHQFLIAEANIPGGDIPPRTLPLICSAGPGSGYVWTGIAAGPVRVEARLLDGRPEDLELDEWETAVETDHESPGGGVFLRSPVTIGNETTDVIVPEPGLYRVLACSKGRGKQWDSYVTEPIEDYRIWFWPTDEPSPPLVHKHTDGMP